MAVDAGWAWWLTPAVSATVGFGGVALGARLTQLREDRSREIERRLDVASNALTAFKDRSTARSVLAAAQAAAEFNRDAAVRGEEILGQLLQQRNQAHGMTPEEATREFGKSLDEMDRLVREAEPQRARFHEAAEHHIRRLQERDAEWAAAEYAIAHWGAMVELVMGADVAASYRRLCAASAAEVDAAREGFVRVVRQDVDNIRNVQGLGGWGTWLRGTPTAQGNG